MHVVFAALSTAATSPRCRRLEDAASAPTLRLLTISSETQDPLADLFVKSALHHGLQPEVLGVSYDAWWPDGLGFKIKVVRDRVRSMACDDDVVLVTDATDVSFFAGADAILAGFARVQKHEAARRATLGLTPLPPFGTVVFNAERWCYPDVMVVENHPRPGVNATWYCPDASAHGWEIPSDASPYPAPPHADSPWAFLNSGGFIGRVGAMKRMLEKPAPLIVGAFGDQGWYQDMYLTRHAQGWMTVDSNCEVFQTSLWFTPDLAAISRTSGVELQPVAPSDAAYWAVGHADGAERAVTEGGSMRMRFYNNKTGTRPPIVHFQGPGHWGLGVTHLHTLHAYAYERAFPEYWRAADMPWRTIFRCIYSLGRECTAGGAPSAGLVVWILFVFVFAPLLWGAVVIAVTVTVVRIVTVSVLLCTVTFYANLAHSLTRSP